MPALHTILPVQRGRSSEIVTAVMSMYALTGCPDAVIDSYYVPDTAVFEDPLVSVKTTNDVKVDKYNPFSSIINVFVNIGCLEADLPLVLDDTS